MPLLRNFAFPNPFGLAMPAPPVAAAAGALAPNQGDHVFGDVVGTIETALQRIFGGGAGWRQRMSAYNPTMRALWDGLHGLDLGHGAHPPLVNRAGPAEPDEHSHMFGGYSERLQWQLAEIVCTGFGAGGAGEIRMIGGYSRSWKNAVLARFDDLMANLVDSTAMAFYIATPNNIRAANPLLVRHVPLSLANAVMQANALHGPGRAAVTSVLQRYGSLRLSVDGILGRFDGGTRTFDPGTNRWV